MEESGGMKPIFTRSVDVDDVVKMGSLCMECHDQGTTSFLYFDVPHFRQIIISSFECSNPECGFSNRLVNSGEAIQDKGCKLTLRVTKKEDLMRQVVLSQYATISIPSLQLEMPKRQGLLTTVEGIIRLSVDELKSNQDARREAAPEIAEKIDEFVKKLEALMLVEEPYEMVLNDPAGNSFLENPLAPSPDPHLATMQYVRTVDQDRDLGCLPSMVDTEDDKAKTLEETEEDGDLDTKYEISTFHGNCPGCDSPVETHMKLVDIPLFKEVIIMSTSCDVCGLRDAEVKGSSGIADLGKRMCLKITSPKDFDRDVLKSETACIFLPELDVELGMGTLGGKFTTVEGLLINIAEQLGELVQFSSGDSQTEDKKSKLQLVKERILAVIKEETPDLHFILDDIAGNSYLENPYHPEKDPHLDITEYTRTEEQDDALGLTGMITEGYEEKEPNESEADKPEVTDGESPAGSAGGSAPAEERQQLSPCAEEPSTSS